MLKGYRGVRGNAWGIRKKPKGFNRGNASNQVYRRQLINLAISIVLILIIILFKSINIPFTQKATEKIKETVNLDYSISDMVDLSLSFLKQTGEKVSDNVIKVFNPNYQSKNHKVENHAEDNSPVFPTQGEIIVTFGEITHPVFGTKYQNYGIDIKPMVSEVKAAIDGIVREIGEEAGKGKYIVLSHDNEILTIYKNLSAVYLNTSDRVKKGSVIGQVNHTQEIGGHLRFEVMRGNRYIDPMELFDDI